MPTSETARARAAIRGVVRKRECLWEIAARTEKAVGGVVWHNSPPFATALRAHTRESHIFNLIERCCACRFARPPVLYILSIQVDASSVLDSS